ncbi:MAG: hypothetical protein ACI83B_000278 [Sediminicola sp.]
MKSPKYLDFLLIIVIASILFAANQFLFHGTIESIDSLGQELQSSPEQLYNWELSKKAPFKYRVVFPLLVKETHSFCMKIGWLSVSDFYFAYLFFSWFSIVLASLGLLLLLKEVFKQRKLAYFGMAAYFISVPFMFAYTVPVHTREDFLAFAFFHWGLWAILRKHELLFVVIAVLGVLTRETLMLLPFIRLFFGFGHIPRRMLVSTVPLISWLVLRWYLGGGEYDRWLGFSWNIVNFDQVVVFGYLSFSFLWIPAILAYQRRLTRFFIRQQAFKIFGLQAFLSSLFLVITTTFVFGIFNEIRLLFLLAPFMITYALAYYQQNRIALINFLLLRRSKLLMALLFTVVAVISFYSVEITQLMFPDNEYGIAYPQWLVVLSIYFLPSLFLIFFEINRKKQIL